MLLCFNCDNECSTAFTVAIPPCKCNSQTSSPVKLCGPKIIMQRNTITMNVMKHNSNGYVRPRKLIQFTKSYYQQYIKSVTL